LTIHRRRISLVFLFLALLLTGLTLLHRPGTPPRLQGHAQRPSGSRLGEASREQLAASFARLPLRFERNSGQTDEQVKFLARGSGYALFLTSNEAVVSLNRAAASKKGMRRPVVSRGEPVAGQGNSAPTAPATLQIKLAGANANAVPEGVDPLPGRTNYMLGNDPSEWRTGVESYSQVRYRNVYLRVDLVYYGSPQQLEYDLVVAPGASPRQIELEIAGASTLQLDPSGELVVSAGEQAGAEPPVRMRRPVIYQQVAGRRHEIAGSYALRGENRVGFEIAAYDASLPLVIDPVLMFSTYFGGSGYDQINAIATDASGNVYVAGSTSSADFPLASPFRGALASGTDAFVSKLSADGSQLIYSTFLGGNDFDSAQALAVDASGVATVGGYTYATNFPLAAAFQTRNNGSADAFVTRLNAGGSALVFSTYLGGGGDDAVYGLAMDGGGNTYITGQTGSGSYPTTVGAAFRNRGSTVDAFVTKLPPAGGSTLVYSSFLGGNSDNEVGMGIAVDSAGSAYVTGYTLSTNFPLANAFQGARAAGTCVDQGFLVPCYDAFVTKLAASGAALVYSTYLGGNGDDNASAIAIDSAGSAYVVGSTNSTNFPTASPLQAVPGGLNDGFIAKLSPAGTSLVYSTYVGGGVNDYADAVAVDSAGDAYVSGGTASTDFPAVNSIQPLNGSNAFVLKMNPGGNSLIYSMFLGGSVGEEAFAIAVDPSGNAVVAGATASPDFPLRNPYQSTMAQTTCVSGNFFVPCPEGFIAKVGTQPSLFGVLNGASFANSAMAAGAIASVFGNDLTSSVFTFTTIPLNTILGNLTVRMNGILAPLYAVSGGQINLQIPWELAGQTQATVQVTANGVAVPSININLANASPGLFSIPPGSSGQGAVQIAGTAIIAAPVGAIAGNTSRPANRGDVVTIYCTGLGPVINQPASGALSPGLPNLATTPVTPVVTIGGIQASVGFAGLAPGFVGLYQVNAQVPATSATGSAVPVAISVNGIPSNTVNIAVQ
jgi:uncharacterized protein (TIGR03437 family)